MTPPAVPEGPYRVQEELSPEGQSYFVVVGPDIDWPGGDETLAQVLNVAYAAGLAAASSPVAGDRPKVVTLCGSTRFSEAFQRAQLEETLAGRIVLTIGCNMKSDAELFNAPDADQIKARLDELHKRKIDLSDEILVLNVGGYVGQSTQSEIDYALAKGLPIRWLEHPANRKWTPPASPVAGGGAVTEEQVEAMSLELEYASFTGEDEPASECWKHCARHVLSRQTRAVEEAVRVDPIYRLGLFVMVESRGEVIGDIDGGTLQDKQQELGLLVEQEIKAEDLQPGGAHEFCEDAEVGGTCLHWSPEALAAMNRARPGEGR